MIEEDVGNTLDDGVRLLARIECVPQMRVDSDDIMDIPEHLFDKASMALLRYNVPHADIAEWTADPHLRIFISTTYRKGCIGSTHIVQILHVVYEIALGIDELTLTASSRGPTGYREFLWTPYVSRAS